MDRVWWNEYGPEISGEFESWTSNAEAARVWGLNFIPSEPGDGVPLVPHMIRQGGNSGFQALGLALVFGAARVILLGYDMQLTGGATHWHGDHVNLGNPLRDRMPKWCKGFAALALATDAEIINATRETALTCFRRGSLDACLS